MQSTTIASSTTVTNQNSGLPSHDTVTTPPRSPAGSPGTVFRVPAAPKSALSVRRSARLAAGKRELGAHVRMCSVRVWECDDLP